MGAGVVTVGRRQYAVGLYWENSPGGRLAQTAKDAAKQPGQQADFYALRPGNKSGRVPQFGLGQSAAGHKTGMPVFAPCLANQQPGSWAGAFRLREGVVVVVVRDDLIVPDGDQFFLNETEARDRLLQEIGFGGLQRVYAPEAWAISGSDTMPISLLMDDRRDIRLSAVQIPKNVLIVAGVLVGLILLGLGGGWYYQEKQAEEEAAEQARQDAMRRLQEQASKVNPFTPVQPKYPPPERVWEKHPSPIDVVAACRDALSQVTAEYAGWKLDAVRCDEVGLSVGWSRDRGMTRVPTKAILDESGSRASLAFPLKPLVVRGPQDLLSSEAVLKKYYAQDWPTVLAAAPDDPPPPPPSGYQGEWNPPPPPWIKRSFTFDVPELPGTFASYVGDIPGVMVEGIVLQSGKWSISGVIYENRN